jgi:hypothetical protein
MPAARASKQAWPVSPLSPQADAGGEGEDGRAECGCLNLGWSWICKAFIDARIDFLLLKAAVRDGCIIHIGC